MAVLFTDGDINPPKDSTKGLREKLATIEHKRWADWMEYMLDCAVKPGDDNIGVRTCGWPTAQFEYWQRQIETDYAALPDQEKASDMEQVDRYWPLIEEYIHKAVIEGKIDELKEIQMSDIHDGLKDEIYNDYIKARIADLKNNHEE